MYASLLKKQTGRNQLKTHSTWQSLIIIVKYILGDLKKNKYNYSFFYLSFGKVPKLPRPFLLEHSSSSIEQKKLKKKIIPNFGCFQPPQNEIICQSVSWFDYTKKRKEKFLVCGFFFQNQCISTFLFDD